MSEFLKPKPLSWSRIEENDQGISYPWPVFEAAIDDVEVELSYLEYGQFVLQCAMDNFDLATVDSALWCGFLGRRLLRDPTYAGELSRTYAVTTPELRAASIPNPCAYAFGKGSQNLPTIAMLSPNLLTPYDFGGEIIGRLYVIEDEATSLDAVTKALYVFRDQSQEDALNSWQTLSKTN